MQRRDGSAHSAASATHAAAGHSTAAAPVPPLAAAPATSGAPSGVWRCPNEVLRRLFPAGSLHSLQGFLTAAPRNYPMAMLLRPGDSESYRHLLERTIVAELQPLALQHAHRQAGPGPGGGGGAAAAAASGARSQLSGASPPVFHFDYVPLATWLSVPLCPRYVAPVALPPVVAPVAPQTGSAVTSAANNPWLRKPAPGRAGAADGGSGRSDGMRSLILHAITRLLSKGQNVSVLTQGYAKVRGLQPLCPAADLNAPRLHIGRTLMHLCNFSLLPVLSLSAGRSSQSQRRGRPLHSQRGDQHAGDIPAVSRVVAAAVARGRGGRVVAAHAHGAVLDTEKRVCRTAHRTALGETLQGHLE